MEEAGLTVFTIEIKSVQNISNVIFFEIFKLTYHILSDAWGGGRYE
jgi:hypothetical protein